MNSNSNCHPETLKLEPNCRFFIPCDLKKCDGLPGKLQRTSSMPFQALCIISAPSFKSNRSYSPDMLNSGQIVDFTACVTWNLMDDLEKWDNTSLMPLQTFDLWPWPFEKWEDASFMYLQTFDLWPWPFAEAWLLSMVIYRGEAMYISIIDFQWTCIEI